MGGAQQIQLKAEDRENGYLGSVAPYFTVLSIEGHLCFQSRDSSSLIFQKLVASGVPMNFVRGRGVQQIQLRTERTGI